MADYQKMYYIMCSAASEALDMLPAVAENESVRGVLQLALLEAEEIYLSAEKNE
ncbi:MAG: hypothetical protein LJU34_06690 [Oscillospiraceae bacterium]|nr:hypothetical protein [Oscillospiraceae bacterium]